MISTVLRESPEKSARDRGEYVWYTTESIPLPPQGPIGRPTGIKQQSVETYMQVTGFDSVIFTLLKPKQVLRRLHKRLQSLWPNLSIDIDVEDTGDF